MKNAIATLHKNNDNIIFAICMLLIVGLLYSKFLISLSVVLMAVNCIIFLTEKTHRKTVFANKHLLFPGLLFGLCLVYIFKSENFVTWLNYSLDRSAFLVFPLGIATLKKREYLSKILLVFACFMLANVVVVLVNYLFNFEAFNKLVFTGSSIWMPIKHTRFTFFAAFAALILFHNYIKTKRWYVLLGFAIIFIGLHILSVRIALVGIYGGLMVYLTLHSIATKKWYLPIIGLGLIFGILLVSYHFVPSFQNKITYMLWDLQHKDDHELGEYSDSHRLRSYKIGWHLTKQHLPFGTGIGLMDNTVNEYYAQHYPNTIQRLIKLPHNQVLSTSLETGILGFITILFVLFFPIIYSFKNQPKLLLSFCAMLIIGFMVEALLYFQMGLVFYSLFIAVTFKLNE